MSGRRTVTPLIQRLRDALNGRKVIEANRYHKELSPRDAPPPNLPGGPSHLLSANYYCNRDGRRAKEAPLVLSNQSQRLLSAGGGMPVITGEKFSKPPTPGAVFDPPLDWDMEGYLEVGERDDAWHEYNLSRKYNKPDA
jgi:NADH dehydrogenase (ubiquinone) 1 alpha subcomplex subunit 7